MQSLELEHYGVVEMESIEMNDVDGGIWPLIAAFALGALAAEIYHHHV